MPTPNTLYNQTDEFAGKVAFITGAGSGIGRATALAFADRGAAVAIADVSAKASYAVADEIVRAGGQALGSHVTSPAALTCRPPFSRRSKRSVALTSRSTTPASNSHPLRSPTSPRINGSAYSTSTCAGCSSA